MSALQTLSRAQHLRATAGGEPEFGAVLGRYSAKLIEAALLEISDRDVDRALLRAGNGTLLDFLALISPQASHRLQEMASLSQSLTRKRFGKTIQFFAPLYLSNECQNICTYCGFSYTNKVPRVTLTREQLLREINVLKASGFDRVLLLTGEHSAVAMDYFRQMIPFCKLHFTEVTIEVQPLGQSDYAELKTLGLDGLTVYQETYHRDFYKIVHPRGKKRDFSYRLGTPERAGQARLHKIGIGALLGLAPWRIDSFFTALHYLYLKKRFWRTEFSLSFPRLRPADDVAPQPSSYQDKVNASSLNERQLAQLIFAYRLLAEELNLSLSTRESSKFRDGIIPLAITSISAGSATNPGGYACYPQESLEQFSIDDTRSPAEVSAQVRRLGLDPIFKDWLREFVS